MFVDLVDEATSTFVSADLVDASTSTFVDNHQMKI